MSRCVVVLLFLSLSACASNPVTIKTSSFDKVTEVSTEAGLIEYSPIRLSLSWRSSAEEKAVITVEIDGAVNLARGESLLFNINGKIEGLKSIDSTTQISTEPIYEGSENVVNRSRKDYVVNMNFIRKLIASKDVKVKLSTSKGYYEGDFSSPASSSYLQSFSAKAYFIEFVKAIGKLKNK